MKGLDRCRSDHATAAGGGQGGVRACQLYQERAQARLCTRILVIAGKLISKRGQQEEKCLSLLERALIRYFLSEGYDLVTKQDMRLRRHEIASKKSKRFVPRLMFVDRAKGA
jgi:hypothetical protein